MYNRQPDGRGGGLCQKKKVVVLVLKLDSACLKASLLVASGVALGEDPDLKRCQGPACAYASLSKERKTKDLRPQPETTGSFLRLNFRNTTGQIVK